MNRIRELLQEEQNFEIINYPTPPQYSVPKKGHKKVRNVEILKRGFHFVVRPVKCVQAIERSYANTFDAMYDATPHSTPPREKTCLGHVDNNSLKQRNYSVSRSFTPLLCDLCQVALW